MRKNFLFFSIFMVTVVLTPMVVSAETVFGCDNCECCLSATFCDDGNCDDCTEACQDVHDNPKYVGICVNPTSSDSAHCCSCKESNDHFGSSRLDPTSCLQSSAMKICFDDIHGGAIQGLYNMEDSAFNYIYPTMGGAFQLAFRSSDPVNLCPDKTWASSSMIVWNPTQAGCEGCYKKDGKWWHSPSFVFNKRITSNEHYVEFKPRNFFHYNMDDCIYPLPYTEGMIQAEDVYVKQRTNIIEDYLKISWEIEHQGDHYHRIKKTYHRNELPVIYFGDIEKEDICFNIAYQDLNGDIQDETLPCKTGTGGFKKIKNSWFTIYDSKNPLRNLTFANNNILIDPIEADLAYRNFDYDNGMQLEFSSFEDVGPNQKFNIQTHIFPYRYDERMHNGEIVFDFIIKMLGTQGDLDGDGTVNESDIGNLLCRFLTTGFEIDFNRDGLANGIDFGEMLGLIK
jgi:hypothetical protein